MAGDGWQDFGIAIRGPARRILEEEDLAKRNRAIGRYNLDADDKTEVFRLETRQAEETYDYSFTRIVGDDEEGTHVEEEILKRTGPVTEKREIKLKGLERTRIIAVALYGVEKAELLLTGKGA